ncbi:hypothetical protein ACA910_021084 [Epithemia clementina (nom. ined.)]
MARIARKLLPCLFALSVVAGNEQGCVDTVEAGVDLFPQKVAPVHSVLWSIEYNGTYKILTNNVAKESYLLYQCGTDVPTDLNTSEFAAVLEIPLKTAGLTQTPMITFMEQIGARDKIGAFLTDPQYIWSPCFAQAVQSGEVAVPEQRSDDQTPSLVGQNPPNLTEMVAFADEYETPPFSQVVKISASIEATNAAIFEWAKYFAVFFNMEETANKVVDAAEERFACIEDKAMQAVTDSVTKPKLLWGYYSDYCLGWDVGECPSYYCEFADSCGVDILNSTEGTNQAAMEKCGDVYMTTEEFIALGKDADFWFFPGPNFDDTLREFGDQLAVFKSVQNQRVYDYQGMGKNSWFEQRYAEYYNVLSDMCLTVGSIQGVERRRFWRNVFTEQVPVDGANAECTANTAANILNDNSQCPTTVVSSFASSAQALVVSAVSVVVAGCVAVLGYL